MSAITEAAADLAAATRGVDWDDEAAGDAVRRLHAAPPDDPQLGDAFAVLLDRLRDARPPDSDGVAHVAISAGTLVERGAPAALLAEALLPLLPEVLQRARGYADRCLAALGDEPTDEELDAELEDPYLEVDGRGIGLDLFRSHIDDDRPGACALAYLTEWTLPAVAALTRDRAWLVRATADPTLVTAAAALRRSGGHWLDTLLGVELDQAWTVLWDGRGFRVVLDGVVDNFTLHALLADALAPHGAEVADNPPEVLAHLRGAPGPHPDRYVSGSFNLYDVRAAGRDLSDPRAIPLDWWVWNEGAPRDVVAAGRPRTLVVGPPATMRTWNCQRTFGALGAEVRVTAELTPAEVRAATAEAEPFTDPPP